MKGRETRGAPSADLLVCFPTRSHLTLMPKPICSPARPAEPNKRSLHHHHRLKKSSFRGGSGGGTQGSPMLWSKSKQMGSDISEPTSPKVTCAGQIKVRPKSGSSCKNWQSVMEEIEKLHNTNKKQKKIKKSSWVEAIGFKKDVMQFLTCLRTIRFDFRCFGSFPNADITTSSDDDEDSDSDEEEKEEENENESTKTVFSKWFMVLQENQNNNNNSNTEIEKSDYIEVDGGATVAPPSNALLLMRCRSAPAKSWLEEREEEEEEEKKGKMVMEEEIHREKKEENLVVMRYDTDFYKLSSDIAKETWVVGGINKDPLSRSRSWKR